MKSLNDCLWEIFSTYGAEESYRYPLELFGNKVITQLEYGTLKSDMQKDPSFNILECAFLHGTTLKGGMTVTDINICIGIEARIINPQYGLITVNNFRFDEYFRTPADPEGCQAFIKANLGKGYDWCYTPDPEAILNYTNLIVRWALNYKKNYTRTIIRIR